mgnify:CR=1 FL=1
MDIVIATSNQNKIRRMEALIAAVNPEIKVGNIVSHNIPTPIEDGKSQFENLMIKLNYYHKFLGGNIITEDDIIELQVDDEFIPIININNFIGPEEDQFLGWKKYLDEHKISGGRLVKCYGVIIDNEVKVEKVIIPLIVKSETENPKQSEKNILNNFIGPEKIGETFVEMTKLERDSYMQTTCLPALTKLLAK